MMICGGYLLTSRYGNIDRNRKWVPIDHGLLVIFGFLCGVVEWLGRKIRKNMLQRNSIDGIEAIGLNSHRVTTGAYQ
jgi:hypothetical protein